MRRRMTHLRCRLKNCRTDQTQYQDPTPTPKERVILYKLAANTGFRANELRSLTRRHLDRKNSSLILDPAWTKNRRPKLQPLPKIMVKQLESLCGSGMVQALYQRFYRDFVYPKDALLYVPSHPARELDKDLKKAGIPKHTEKGKVAFHALRTCFVSLTYEAGASHKEAQELARHATPTLTAITYGRARDERLATVVEMVAERVLSGQVVANTVHETESDVTAKVIKLLPEQQVTNNSEEWRRGDSNPRPEMLQDKLLHA